MPIEVWKKQMFKTHRLEATGLHVFLREGKAYATWTSAPLFSSQKIPLSDELAAQVLGAERVPCPFVDTQPKYSMLGKPGYTCRDKTIGEDCNTIERCTVCGFDTFYAGNPRFRAAFGSGQHSVDGHPPTTYLKAAREYGILRHANWDTKTGSLVPPSDDSTLIIWVVKRSFSVRVEPNSACMVQ